MKLLALGDDTRSLFMRQYGYACVSSEFRERRGEGSFQENMKRIFGLDLTDEQVRKLKKELAQQSGAKR